MLLQAVWDFFQTRVFGLPSQPGLFNLYAGEDADCDCPGAAGLRRENLHAYLESFAQPPAWLLVGEAPGWKGCRFSGVPFTSEAQLARRCLPFDGQPTSRYATRLSEASATVFWETLYQRHPSFLVWNCIPLHPHQPGQPLSNRTPTPTEIKSFAPLLAGLIDVLRPVQVIAIGRKAQLALRQVGQPAGCVRHPGHGGKHQFQSEIKNQL